MNSQMCKIFVGNVPFQCNQLEFSKCFESYTGFIKAEIVYKQNTNISRGFGFVTFDNKTNADVLLNEKLEIKCKNRLLRFTEYEVSTSENKFVQHMQNIQNNFKNKKQDISKNQYNFEKNVIIVKNKTNVAFFTRNYLHEVFKKYGNITKYFIMSDQDTGTPKDCGIIEFADKKDYENILKEKEIISDDGTIFEINKWKTKIIHITPTTNSKKNFNKIK